MGEGLAQKSSGLRDASSVFSNSMNGPFFTGQESSKMPCPDPACAHRTEFSPADQELDTKLSQSILAGSRSDQTDGEVLMGVYVTSRQQLPQRQRQVRRELCVSRHQVPNEATEERNVQGPSLQDGVR